MKKNLSSTCIPLPKLTLYSCLGLANITSRISKEISEIHQQSHGNATKNTAAIPTGELSDFGIIIPAIGAVPVSLPSPAAANSKCLHPESTIGYERRVQQEDPTWKRPFEW
jgi:hypothetical protein